MTGTLAGKHALVTGSTGGMGVGIARALAEAGADVMLNGFGDAAEIGGLRAARAACVRPRSSRCWRNSAGVMIQVRSCKCRPSNPPDRRPILHLAVRLRRHKGSFPCRKASSKRAEPAGD